MLQGTRKKQLYYTFCDVVLGCVFCCVWFVAAAVSKYRICLLLIRTRTTSADVPNPRMMSSGVETVSGLYG